MYGFGLLDDLHNFYPEILYDETLFPDQRFGWFRHRTSTLFPSIFSRQINTYRIYNAAERQHMFNTWINSQAIGIQTRYQSVAPTAAVPAATVPAVPAVPAAPADHTVPAVPAAATATTASIASIRPIATLLYSTPSPATVTATSPARVTDNTAANILMRMALDEGLAPQTPQRTPSAAMPNPPSRRGVTGRTTQFASDIDILSALLTIPTTTHMPRNANPLNPLNPLNSLFGANDLLSLLTTSMNFQDVLVIPTLNQIEAASLIIEHADVAADENCAICQEHTIPGQQSPWRRLHCSHQFHTSCIMTWFQRNVHCPVCRADIRDIGSTQADDQDDRETRSDMSTSTEETES
jgi:hypothetical protein